MDDLRQRRDVVAHFGPDIHIPNDRRSTVVVTDQHRGVQRVKGTRCREGADDGDRLASNRNAAHRIDQPERTSRAPACDRLAGAQGRHGALPTRHAAG